VRKKIQVSVALLICVLSAAVLITLLLVLPTEKTETPPSGPGPLYKGRSTKDWVGKLDTADEKQNPVVNDIVAIGSPAVPYLLERFRDPRPRIARNKTYLKLWDSLPRWMQRHLAIPLLPYPLAMYYSRKAAVIDTLGKMGTNAAAAIPALLQFIDDKDNDACIRYHAIVAIRSVGVGSEAIPTLRQRLEDDHIRGRRAFSESLGTNNYSARLDAWADDWDWIQRDTAAITIACITNHCDGAIPAIQKLADATNGRPSSAIVALWALAPSPQIQKRIENGLSDTNHRLGFIGALGSIGKSSQPFVPLLVEIRSKMSSTDSNQWAVMERTGLENALKRIAPEYQEKKTSSSQ